MIFLFYSYVCCTMESTCETGPGVVTPLAAELVIAVLKLATYSGPMELGSLAG